MKCLLSYYSGDGPSREKLAAFIRTYLVYDGAAVPDELIDIRYQASLDPEVVANPRCNGRKGCGRWGMDLTRDRRLKRLPNPTLVLWGRDDKVNRPSGGPLLLNLMPNAELVMTSHTGHWMQWGARRSVQPARHRIPRWRITIGALMMSTDVLEKSISATS